MQYSLILVATLALGVSAAPGPKITPAPRAAQLQARASLPKSSGSSKLSAVKTIAAGASFDGGMYMYDRGVSCTGQEEGGDSDAVFQLEKGATREYSPVELLVPCPS